ncbi:hypothetical protein COO60DRAFT_1703160 [Scenedesmus sp. NREL 46B-D3]|nr:hypothetical protein COO60DRAFT_1703160 [Scenedesmus sp. NREL 46B-D3]
MCGCEATDSSSSQHACAGWPRHRDQAFCVCRAWQLVPSGRVLYEAHSVVPHMLSAAHAVHGKPHHLAQGWCCSRVLASVLVPALLCCMLKSCALCACTASHALEWKDCTQRMYYIHVRGLVGGCLRKFELPGATGPSSGGLCMLARAVE